MAAKASRWVTWMTPESTNNVSDLGALRPTSAPRIEEGVRALEREGPQQHEDPTWAATFDKASTQVWQDDDAEVTMSYNGSAEVGGWYRFGLTFSPVITIELKHPIPLAQFMTTWAWPLEGLVSAATGKKERITYLSCSPVIEDDDRPPQRRQFQVFQASVSQEPYASTNDLRDKRVPAIRLGEGETLLRLLRRWQELQHEQNPILNTYDADALGPDQTPRARFLLLIQALEGLCGHEDRLAHQLPKFEAKRTSVLSRCEQTLNPAEFGFLKRFLAKSPWNLDAVLRDMLKSLPADLEPELANCDLVKMVIVDADANVDTTLGALRYVRNGLSHGTNTFDPDQLHDAAGILQRVVRGHLLRLLEASDAARSRAVEPPER